MTKGYIENFVGTFVKITLINSSTFQGLLWFVRFEDETEEKVHSINLDSSEFSFKIEHIISIERVEDE
jgi:hypothetical protein